MIKLILVKLFRSCKHVFGFPKEKGYSFFLPSFEFKIQQILVLEIELLLRSEVLLHAIHHEVFLICLKLVHESL